MASKNENDLVNINSHDEVWELRGVVQHAFLRVGDRAVEVPMGAVAALRKEARYELSALLHSVENCGAAEQDAILKTLFDEGLKAAERALKDRESRIVERSWLLRPARPSSSSYDEEKDVLAKLGSKWYKLQAPKKDVGRLPVVNSQSDIDYDYLPITVSLQDLKKCRHELGQFLSMIDLSGLRRKITDSGFRQVVGEIMDGKGGAELGAFTRKFMEIYATIPEESELVQWLKTAYAAFLVDPERAQKEIEALEKTRRLLAEKSPSSKIDELARGQMVKVGDLIIGSTPGTRSEDRTLALVTSAGEVFVAQADGKADAGWFYGAAVSGSLRNVVRNPETHGFYRADDDEEKEILKAASAVDPKLALL